MLWKLTLLDHNEEIPAKVHSIELEAGNLPQANLLSELVITAAYPNATLSFHRPRVEDNVFFLTVDVDREHMYLDSALVYGLELA